MLPTAAGGSIIFRTRRSCNVLGVSVAVGGVQGEIRGVAHHDFHLLAGNGDAFSGEHILVEALEVLRIECRLVEHVLGREPVEVGIACRDVNRT